MRLVSARVENFKCILDSGEVSVEPDVTCLVGQNEAGKSAWLSALARLNPVPGSLSGFNVDDDWPAGQAPPSPDGLSDTSVVAAEFDLDDRDWARVVEAFGRNVLSSDRVTLRRMFDGQLRLDAEFDEAALLSSAADALRDIEIDIPDVGAAKSLASLMAALHEMDTEGNAELESARHAASGVPALNANEVLAAALSPGLPQFLYFDDYARLDAKFDMAEILNRQGTDESEPSDQTVLALLRLAGVDPSALVQTESSERLIKALDRVGGEVTGRLSEIWSQNPNLRVEFRTIPGTGQPGGIEVRIRDAVTDRVGSISLRERSTGFIWFFSFYARYLALNLDPTHPLVLLLDEPGLHLHASAQEDLVALLSSGLAAGHQVIFTTHSPFMIDPDRFGGVRAVSRDEHGGTKVESRALRLKDDALLPLQAALGYSLSQTLFIGRNLLLVEGPADLRYIQVMRGFLERDGRAALDPRWVIVPVGGKDKLPSFVSLFGREFNCAVLADGTAGDHQRLAPLIGERGVIGPESVFYLGDYIARKDASIEDLFGDKVFMGFAARALALRSTATPEPRAKDSIVRRLSRAMNPTGAERFNHHAPIDELEQASDTYLKGMKPADRERWEKLFADINGALT